MTFLKKINQERNGKMKNSFSELLKNELVKARIKNPPINSVHEGYSIILEEVDEFWDWVKMKKKLRDPNEMLTELVQIAAMAQRTAEDVVIPILNK